MADFSKGMIYSCLVLSAVGAGTHVWMTQAFDEAGKETQRALKKLNAIAVSAEDIRTLEGELKNDIWIEMTGKGQGRFDEFFGKCAEKAGMPDPPDVERPRDDTPRNVESYKDTSYEMSWKNLGRRGSKLKGFTRQQVAAFLWNLEDSPLLRVTYLRMEGSKEFDDMWVPQVKVTERRPIGGSTTPSEEG